MILPTKLKDCDFGIIGKLLLNLTDVYRNTFSKAAIKPL